MVPLEPGAWDCARLADLTSSVGRELFPDHGIVKMDAKVSKYVKVEFRKENEDPRIGEYARTDFGSPDESVFTHNLSNSSKFY